MASESEATERYSPPGESAQATPFFIVGCQRSGTTALAVMFDRHSRIAMLPETQFFNKFVVQDRRAHAPMTHEALVDRAISDFFIRQAHLPRTELLQLVERYPPSYENLFRAILECYAKANGKVRAAEKSCNHLFHHREILTVFPDAKIICIVRDGRDVVRSLMKVSQEHWRTRNWLPLFCRQWNEFVRYGRKCNRMLPDDRFTLVRFEDLMTHPEQELRRLCRFIGEPFEPTQIEAGTSSSVVPDYEVQWKGQARGAPDPGRVAAWRTCPDPQLIAQMNTHMGPMLRAMGYSDTGVRSVSRGRRLIWGMHYLPLRRGLFPISLRIHRMVRSLKHATTRPPAAESERRSEPTQS